MGYPHYSADCSDFHSVLRRPVLAEVDAERRAQDAKWGEQNHPDGTGDQALLPYLPTSEPSGRATYGTLAYRARQECDARHRAGTGTFADILLEEVGEALAEDDPARLRAELVQVAAVAVAWAEAIDRRAEASDRQRPVQPMRLATEEERG